MTMTSGAVTTMDLNQIIEQAQRALDMDDEVLARALELSTKTFKFIKAGSLRLPWGKLVPLAETLELDLGVLLEMQMRQSSPELFDVIERVWAPLSLSASERNLIRECRRLAGGQSAGPIVFEGRSVVALVIP